MNHASGERDARELHLLAAPDSFKGTCSAPEVAGAIAAGARDAGWDAEVCPLSDGGEGFTEVLAFAESGRDRGEGEWRAATVTGPLGDPVEARWWWSSQRAVVECAAASGLVLAGGAGGNDPMLATSRGTGELVAAAVASGAKRVLVGLGGSASTDGGSGAVDAICESGGIGPARVVAACDVHCGFTEAASRFGPQKGANPSQVAALEVRLEKLADQYLERYGVDVSSMELAGAAGGVAGGLAALGAELVGGFDLVAREVRLRRRIAQAQLVVTGEGALDVSSWTGKVVGGVVRECARAKLRVLVVAGTVAPGVGDSLGAGGIPRGLIRPEIVSLSETFGSQRAMKQPYASIREAVAQALRRSGS